MNEKESAERNSRKRRWDRAPAKHAFVDDRIPVVQSSLDVHWYICVFVILVESHPNTTNRLCTGAHIYLRPTAWFLKD